MILQRLAEMAQVRGLVEDPNYVIDRVDFWLTVDDRGRAKLRPAGSESIQAPVVGDAKRTSGVLPRFFFDNAKYVLGLTDPKKDAEGKSAQKYSDAFGDLVANVVKDTEDPGAKALLKFLQNRTREMPGIFKVYPLEKWTGSENLGIIYAGDIPERPMFSRPLLAKWFSEARAARASESMQSVPCLDTDGVDTPERLHNPIKRVPGAQSSGVPLVSYNRPAFESHGWEQGANAPVSRATGAAYAAGLNWLLAEEGSSDLPKQVRFRQGLALGTDLQELNLVALWWTAESHPIEQQLVKLFNRPETKDVECLSKGSDAEGMPFYTLILSGHQGRIAVRSFSENTVGAVRGNLVRWFDTVDTNAFYKILQTVRGPSGRDAASSVRISLFNSVIGNTALPQATVSLLLQRKLDPGPEPKAASEKQNFKQNRRICRQTLQFFLGGSPVALDLTCRLVPYRRGRLFALYEYIQRTALPHANTTIRDQYFRTARQTPDRVSVQLHDKCLAHIKKIKTRKYGLAMYFDKLLESFNDFDTAPPARMSLQDQDLFERGYYHQRTAFYAKKSDDTTEAAGSAAA